MLTETAASARLRTETVGRIGYGSMTCYVLGVSLIALALIVPNAYYSLGLSGRAKDLSWGPGLFRLLLLFHGALLILFATGAFNWLAPSRATSNVRTRTSATTWFALIGLTLIALVLRLWNLNSPPWIDEVLTLVDFARLSFAEIVTSFPNQNQHMLYSVLAHGAFTLFGESTWALRLPAVLFGLGSIWTLFFFARHVTGVREALLACALMTVSYHHVWFSQNARGYSGLLMMTLLATWAWLEALKRDEWKWWFLYVAAIVTGMWIHTTMAFVVAAQGLLHLLFLTVPKLAGEEVSLERRAGLRPFIAWLLSVTVTLQLYALSLPEFLRTGLHEESRNSEWTNPIWVVTESVQNLSIGFSSIAVLLVGAAFVCFGWLSIFRRDRRAAVLMVAPPIMSGGLMLLLGHNLFPRFFFFAMGFGILIVIHGALELPDLLVGASKRIAVPTVFARRIGVAAALFMIAVSLITVPRNYALPKQDFVAAREYVEGHLSPGGRAVAVNLAGDMFAKYYAPNWLTTREASMLDELEQQGTDVWLVYTMPFEIQAFTPELWRKIQDEYDVVQTFPGTLNGGEVVVSRRRREVGNK